MPLYEFICKSEVCKKEFESLMRPYDPVRCPECGSLECEKKFPLTGGYKWKNGCGGSSTTPKKYEALPE